jgi:hypothetical protein
VTNVTAAIFAFQYRTYRTIELSLLFPENGEGRGEHILPNTGAKVEMGFEEYYWE